MTELLTEDTVFLMKLLDARIVGGAVRDALLEVPVKDIDFASPLTPEQVTDICSKNNIVIIPTGIKHGTVTIRYNSKNYEITTLRKDVSADGRHAEIAFTDDWELDSSRRDFTINAFYMDYEGKIYDYHNGKEDLQKKLVRFIGEPEKRIKEDYLRILRFFRFYAQMGSVTVDEKALNACAKLSSHIKELSAERITHEFLRLLECASPQEAIRLMQNSRVLEQFLKEAVSDNLDGYIRKEKLYDVPISPLARLSSTLCLTKMLRFSHKQKEILRTLAKMREKPITDASELYEILYDTPKELVLQGLLLSNKETYDLVKTIKEWEKIPFPLTGQDVLALGIPESARVGELLRETMKWWFKHSCKPSYEECLKNVKCRI
ncbi:MAG: CCA tRNA nucleotidyltransferase [Alphaproteobacteria bacterium]|nr:CCA tRNA nucleotidyltransferase [Alphaproteobacteria bacterium]